MEQRRGLPGASEPNSAQAGLGNQRPLFMPQQPGGASTMPSAGHQGNQPTIGYTQLMPQGYDIRGSAGSDPVLGIQGLQTGYAAGVPVARHHQQPIPSVAAASPTPQQQQLNIQQHQQIQQQNQQPHRAPAGATGYSGAGPAGSGMSTGVRSGQQTKRQSASSAVAAAIAQDEKARLQAAAALAARDYADKQAASAGGVSGPYGAGPGILMPVSPKTSSLPNALAAGAPSHMTHFSQTAASTTGVQVSTNASAPAMGVYSSAASANKNGVFGGTGGSGSMAAALFNSTNSSTTSGIPAQQQQQGSYYSSSGHPQHGSPKASTAYTSRFPGSSAAAPTPGNMGYTQTIPTNSNVPLVGTPWGTKPSGQSNNRESGGSSSGGLINVGLPSGTSVPGSAAAAAAAPSPAAAAAANAAGAGQQSNSGVGGKGHGQAAATARDRGSAAAGGSTSSSAAASASAAVGIQEQMSPSAVQAIQQISKLRDAQYNRGPMGSASEDLNASYSSEEGGNGQLQGRGQGWRSAHRGGAYSLSVGTRSGGARTHNSSLDPTRATLGELAAKVQAEEKNRLSRVAGASGGGGGGGLPGIQGGDHKSVDANGNPVAGEGGRRGRRGDSGHDGSDSDGGSMSSGSDGEGGRLGGLCQPGTEQTGRWTKDEHELFLKALKKYGKEWKRVACMVRTRTVVQTRTHAQKYFQKLTKAAQGGGIALDDGDGPDLMDIEVHMNTIDSNQTSTAHAGSGAARTRGGAKRTRTTSAGAAGSPPTGGGAGAASGAANEREGTRTGRQPQAKREVEEGDGAGEGAAAGTSARGRRPRSNSAAAAAASAAAASVSVAGAIGAAGATAGEQGVGTSSSSSSTRYGRGGGSGVADDLDRREQHPYYYAGYGGGGSTGYGRRDVDEAGGRARYGDVDRGHYYNEGRGESAKYAAHAAGDAAQRIGMLTPQRGGGSGSGAGRGIDRRLAPSPPGEGSRKREELAVAELLANSSSGGRARSRGGNVLGSSCSSNSAAGSAGLRITNPDLFGQPGGAGSGASAAALAATPWDGEVNNLSENLPAARGRMTPTDEVSRSFAETYSSANSNANANAGNEAWRPHATGAGALHRNISQGQVAGALKLIEEAKAARDRNRAKAAAAKPTASSTSATPPPAAAGSNATTTPANMAAPTAVPAAHAGSSAAPTTPAAGPASAGAPGGGPVGRGQTAAPPQGNGQVTTTASGTTTMHSIAGQPSAYASPAGAFQTGAAWTSAAAAAAAAAMPGTAGAQAEAATASADNDVVDVEKQDDDGVVAPVTSGGQVVHQPRDVVSEEEASVGGVGGAGSEKMAGGGGGAVGGGDRLLDLVNEVDKFGFTPLMLAASMQRAPGDRGCIGTGPDTAYSLCEALLAHGANRNAADTAGNTALHWAAWVGNHLVVRLLSANSTAEGINRQNEEGDTALHFASRWGGVTAVRVLLTAGADANILNSEGRIPLAVAGDGLASEGNLKDIDRDSVRREFFERDPTNRTLILHHPDCLEHMPKTASDWECPERVSAILEKLRHPALFDYHELEISNDFERVTSKALLRVHTSPYVKFVNDLSKQLEADDNRGSVPFTPMVQRQMLKKGESDVKPKDSCDTSFSAGSLKAARRAAGAVTHAVDKVVTGQNRNAFCVVRPPGHHAGPSGLLEAAVSCGFCIFNNVAVGALHALEGHGLERVAIVDIDVHHGNGTEEICRAYPHPHRLLFFSVHLYDRGPSYEFFPGSGAQDYIQGNIINAPLNPLWKGGHDSRQAAHGTRSQRSKAREPEPRTGRLCYREALTSRLLPALRAFNPDLVLLSAGFDAAKGDVGNCRQERRGSSGGLDLQAEDYLWTTERIQQVADICCNGKMVSVLEGGYGQDTKSFSGSHAHDIVRPTAVRAGAGGDVWAQPGGEGGIISDEDRRSSGGSGHGHGHGDGRGNDPLPRSAGYQAADSAAQCLNRSGLGNNVAAHVRALVDPYRSQVKEEARVRRVEKEKDEGGGMESDEEEPDRKKGRVGR